MPPHKVVTLQAGSKRFNESKAPFDQPLFTHRMFETLNPNTMVNSMNTMTKIDQSLRTTNQSHEATIISPRTKQVVASMKSVPTCTSICTNAINA